MIPFSPRSLSASRPFQRPLLLLTIALLAATLVTATATPAAAQEAEQESPPEGTEQEAPPEIPVREITLPVVGPGEVLGHVRCVSRVPLQSVAQRG